MITRCIRAFVKRYGEFPSIADDIAETNVEDSSRDAFVLLSRDTVSFLQSPMILRRRMLKTRKLRRSMSKRKRRKRSNRLMTSTSRTISLIPHVGKSGGVSETKKEATIFSSQLFVDDDK